MDIVTLIGGSISWVFWFVIPFLLVLSIVVFVHELGHFWAGRFFGVKIEAFSLGFGRELFAWVDRHGTRWRVAALPLGGYVKFWGDADATTARADETILAGGSAADRAAAFVNKPLYQKAIIAAAGPIANFVLAIAIFTGLNMIIGERVLPPRIGEVAAGSPAEKAGIKPGDLIVSVNGLAIKSFVEFAKAESLSTGIALALNLDRAGEPIAVAVVPVLQDRDDGQGGKVAAPTIGVQPYLPPYVTGLTPGSAAESAGVKVGDLIERVDGKPIQSLSGLVDIVRNGGGKPVELGLSRDGQAVTLTVTPQFKTGPDGAMRFMIGVQSDPDSPNARFKVETIYHGPVTAFSKAVGDTWFIISKVMEFFGQLFTGTGDYRQLSGPIGIAKVSSDVAQVSLAGLINLIAVLSVSIGLLNLLPIPILDGGHLLYYAIEGIRGRPLGERAQEFGFRIGLVFVLGLMAVATFNDIVKVAARIFGPAA